MQLPSFVQHLSVLERSRLVRSSKRGRVRTYEIAPERFRVAEDWLTAQRQETADREKVAFERWKRRHEKNVEDFVDDIESEADTARRFNRAAKDLVDAMTESIKKSGEIPAKLGNEMAQRFLGRMHHRGGRIGLGHPRTRGQGEP